MRQEREREGWLEDGAVEYRDNRGLNMMREVLG